jgi:hypothetical protein
MTLNLLSVYRFCQDNNASFYFDASKFRIQDLPTGNLLYSGLSENGLYPIRGAMLPSSSSVSSCFSAVHLPPQVWHNRLGHPQDRVLRHLLANNTHVQTVSHKFPFCTHCVESKMHKLPFTDSTSITTRPLELVHSDVWGLAPVTSINEIRYYVIFVDDFMRFTWYQSHPLGVEQTSPLLFVHVLMIMPHVRGHIIVRVLSHIDQVFLGCAIYKS